MKLSDNYAIDLSGLFFLSWYSFQLFTLSICGQLSKKYHHSPRFGIYFVILNFVIIDFEIYNVNHAEYEKDDSM